MDLVHPGALSSESISAALRFPKLDLVGVAKG